MNDRRGYQLLRQSLFSVINNDVMSNRRGSTRNLSFIRKRSLNKKKRSGFNRNQTFGLCDTVAALKATEL